MAALNGSLVFFAAWFLAIGAIAALALAIWIANWQRSFERKEAEEKKGSLLFVYWLSVSWPSIGYLPGSWRGAVGAPRLLSAGHY
jgi:hypothetical protein